MRYRSIFAFLLALCVGLMTLGSRVEAAQNPLTYDQIRNTGKAGLCPTVADSARGRIDIPLGQTVRMTDLCFQPVQLEVEEEKRNGDKEFVKAIGIMLYAATIGPVKADLTAVDNTTLRLKVVDGMASQPTTAQMPRRELVPLLFSLKELDAIATGSDHAISSSTDFEGDFLVPGYRSSSFLDPKGRGSATGYEEAVGLQAARDEFEATTKTDELSEGHLSLRIARVDPVTGEIAGSFISNQPSSSEQGTLEVHEVRIQGLFYGRVEI
ncbi:MAG: photosystem II manganese-stabilizing protein [Synechococcaceae cyanobacterium SM2_3_2]|nr:photosystem II manganese-stabilizing protein [Synechococcaceae cyanobacterium SM2_3_2]